MEPTLRHVVISWTVPAVLHCTNLLTCCSEWNEVSWRAVVVEQFYVWRLESQWQALHVVRLAVVHHAVIDDNLCLENADEFHNLLRLILLKMTEISVENILHIYGVGE